ncbi:MAG: penicillin-binding protein [Azospira oryzae]|jgi:beta-lactam-binding protein with PASTA domain|nr:MAG: penicillin-binding protein [Azospira oryzae]
MKFKIPFSDNKLGNVLLHFAISIGIILLICICYFYIYLPSLTNWGESITVPSLVGKNIDELERFAAEHDLRVEVSDSSYSQDYSPLSVLLQFPKAGTKVKEGRLIYVTINQINPPTVPVPNLVDGSRINAEVVLKSNELRRGQIILSPSPLLNLVKEMRYQGKPIQPGTRVPKGSLIDLVVGDGNGATEFPIGNLVGDTYDMALFKLSGWVLHSGNIQIPEGVDTTGVELVVYKQHPEPGEMVHMGDPIDLWIAPSGYEEQEPEENENPE